LPMYSPLPARSRSVPHQPCTDGGAAREISPAVRSLTTQRVVERSLHWFARRTAIIDGARTLSYGDLADRTGRLANALLARGAGGRAVAVWLPNRLEYIEVDVACARAGAIRVAIGHRLSADECAYIVEHSRSVLLITPPELHARLAGLG